VRDALLILPAYNEAESLEILLPEVAREARDLDVLVVNDGSTDGTAAAARRHGAALLDLACNLGVGGAVQTGFAYAWSRGYRFAVRCDADGQHPPAEIGRLLAAVRQGEADVAVGSRFLGRSEVGATWVRSIGIACLARFLSLLCRTRVTDPTSGFQAVNRVAMRFLACCYPSDYPEPEALALLRRQGYGFREVAVRFRERLAGVSTLDGWTTVNFAFKVFLALCVGRARPVDARLSRRSLLEAT
jgi:glycosyltransferase involved in cell wall biosynthesis